MLVIYSYIDNECKCVLKSVEHFQCQQIPTNNISPVTSANTNTNTGDQEEILPKIMDSEIVVLDLEGRTSSHRSTHDNGSSQNENTKKSDEKRIEEDCASLTLSHDMIKPETEADALACLISSNYLSGYYAGTLQIRIISFLFVCKPTLPFFRLL